MANVIDGLAIFNGISFEIKKVEEHYISTNGLQNILSIEMQQGSKIILESNSLDEALILQEFDCELTRRKK